MEILDLVTEIAEISKKIQFRFYLVRIPKVFGLQNFIQESQKNYSIIIKGQFFFRILRVQQLYLHWGPVEQSLIDYFEFQVLAFLVHSNNFYFLAILIFSIL